MHYATQDWTDYVRGIEPKPRAAAMQHHLDSGCDRCSRVVDLMRRVAYVTAMPQVEVPASVIHKAKAIFNIPRKSTLARLVFDSFLQPLPAGVRSRAHMVRQAMFEAGDMLVDVRLHREQDGRLVVAGQVADKSSPNRYASRLVLHLVSGSERRRLDANRFGEFQTFFAAGSNVHLEISGLGLNIDVPLHEVTAPSTQEPEAKALDFVLKD
jgi:hypothetical protein